VAYIEVDSPGLNLAAYSARSSDLSWPRGRGIGRCGGITPPTVIAGPPEGDGVMALGQGVLGPLPKPPQRCDRLPNWLLKACEGVAHPPIGTTC
jgi:hypothetical protein